MDVELEEVISRLKIFPFHNQIIRPLDGGGGGFLLPTIAL